MPYPQIKVFGLVIADSVAIDQPFKRPQDPRVVLPPYTEALRKSTYSSGVSLGSVCACKTKPEF